MKRSSGDLTVDVLAEEEEGEGIRRPHGVLLWSSKGSEQMNGPIREVGGAGCVTAKGIHPVRQLSADQESKRNGSRESLSIPMSGTVAVVILPDLQHASRDKNEAHELSGEDAGISQAARVGPVSPVPCLSHQVDPEPMVSHPRTAVVTDSEIRDYGATEKGLALANSNENASVHIHRIVHVVSFDEAPREGQDSTSTHPHPLSSGTDGSARCGGDLKADGESLPDAGEPTREDQDMSFAETEGIPEGSGDDSSAASIDHGSSLEERNSTGRSFLPQAPEPVEEPVREPGNNSREVLPQMPPSPGSPASSRPRGRDPATESAPDACHQLSEDPVEPDSISDSVGSTVVSMEEGRREAGCPEGIGSTHVAAGPMIAEKLRRSTRKVGPPAKVIAEEPTLVLPCAPSDSEKVMYYKTDRFTIIFCGSFAFVTILVASAMFTITAPLFYWFGVPTAFLAFYVVSHYFVVAVWGRDFKPESHEAVVRQAASDGAHAPQVDVYLPVCNESTHLLVNTWEHVAALDYESFVVHVLDDGAQDEVRDLAERFGFEYMRRPDRPQVKKAGNLRHAFSRTSADLIVIFDADFCPRPDFLRETVPYFLDPTIGIVQTPQFFRWREEQTWVEQGAGVTQELFYRMVQMNHDRFSAAYCAGSCGVYRRKALEPLGGMVAISHSEDMHTGFKITDFGFKVKYLPLVLSMGTCPDEPRTFFMQQYRWCMGTLSLVLGGSFWRSRNVSLIQKICFFNGMLYYTATALLVFMAPVPMLLLVWFNAGGVLWYHMGFVVPSVVFAAIVIPYWAKQRYGMSCHRVKILQCYAHLYAFKDHIMGTVAPWVPSGGGASRSSSKAYRSSTWLLTIWNSVSTVLIVGGSCWRMTQFPWYHFVPIVVLAVVSFSLNMSTLWY